MNDGEVRGGEEGRREGEFKSGVIRPMVARGLLIVALSPSIGTFASHMLFS
jgi:hypothetical protein